MSLADLIKDLPTTPMVERKHNPLIIPEIKMYIASIGGKEEFHKIFDTKKYAAEFLGFCAEFMANGGEANEIMIKSCDLIDTWFCENRPSLKHYTDHGITHFSDESHKWLFESDLYLAFIEVVQTEDYVKQLSFYWSDTMYALYGKLN
jgi:hypothetical protein